MLTLVSIIINGILCFLSLIVFMKKNKSQLSELIKNKSFFAYIEITQCNFLYPIQKFVLSIFYITLLVTFKSYFVI